MYLRPEGGVKGGRYSFRFFIVCSTNRRILSPCTNFPEEKYFGKLENSPRHHGLKYIYLLTCEHNTPFFVAPPPPPPPIFLLSWSRMLFMYHLPNEEGVTIDCPCFELFRNNVTSWPKRMRLKTRLKKQYL